MNLDVGRCSNRLRKWRHKKSLDYITSFRDRAAAQKEGADDGDKKITRTLSIFPPPLFFPIYLIVLRICQAKEKKLKNNRYKMFIRWKIQFLVVISSKQNKSLYQKHGGLHKVTQYVVFWGEGDGG